MCGIIYSNSANEFTFKEALKSLNNRGPDSSRMVALGANEFIGHTRLSLFDLSDDSAQPVRANKIYFSYNGEIFNFKNLSSLKSDTLFIKDFLENRSTSDFISNLNQLNGFFSILIKDGQNLYSIRDRFGEKPCYIYFKDNKFSVASSISALLAIHRTEMNTSSFVRLRRDPFAFKESNISDYLFDTAYEHIYELKPGCYLKYDQVDFSLELHEWYNLAEDIELYKDKDLYELIKDSIFLREQSDAKGCFSLSGGVDSTFIVAHSNTLPKNTFSVVSSHEQYSEESEIKKISFKLKTNSRLLSEKGALVTKTSEEVYENLSIFDYPYFDPNISQSILYKTINDNGYKFIVDGHGADELFLGYQHHVPYLFIAALVSLKFRSAYNLLKYFNESFPDNFSYFFRAGIFFKNILRMIKFKKKKYFGFTPKKYDQFRFDEMFNRVLLRLLNNYDAISMHHSVEVRSPFLDHRVVANVLSKDNDFFYTRKSKYFLKQILHNKHKIAIQQKKIGFRSYIWNDMNPQELQKLFYFYHAHCKKYKDLYDNKLSLENIRESTPRDEHKFWKSISARMLELKI